MSKILRYLPQVLLFADALESIIKGQLNEGVELRPTIKGIRFRIRIERA